MFFFLLPTGLDFPGRRRMAVGWVILALLVFRGLLAAAHPSLRIQALTFFPPRGLGVEFVSAMVQSLFTPVVPPGLTGGQAATLVGGAVGAILFWLIFGAGLETRLGRGGLALFYVVGGALGALLCATPWAGMSGAFWLGHASAVFCLGAATSLLLTADLKVFYAYYMFLGTTSGSANQGFWRLPAFLALGPLFLLLAWPQWMAQNVPADLQPGLTVRNGPFGPFSWSLAVAGLGAGAGWVWNRARERRMP